VLKFVFFFWHNIPLSFINEWYLLPLHPLTHTLSSSFWISPHLFTRCCDCTYTHRCITVLMSWVHVSYFVYSHSYTCHWMSGVKFLIATVSWQINARVECVSELSLSDIRVWMVCLWRWQCWCNTASPPVTQQPQW